MSLPRTFVITVNRPEPIPKYEATCKHLQEMGIPFEPFYGLDNRVCQLLPVDTFDIDRVGDKISSTHIAAHLTHYLMWKVLSYMPEDAFWVLEYDAQFEPGWRERYEDAMSVIPDDWDVVFLGSCCTVGRPTVHIGKSLYEVKWPLCGHAIMYRKKALPVLLEAHQKVWAPLDIALYHDSLPKLKVYTILPRMVSQLNTAIPA
jgi:hypothetical protein